MRGDEIPVSVHRRSENPTQPKKWAWFNTGRTGDADPAPRDGGAPELQDGLAQWLITLTYRLETTCAASDTPAPTFYMEGASGAHVRLLATSCQILFVDRPWAFAKQGVIF